MTEEQLVTHFEDNIKAFNIARFVERELPRKIKADGEFIPCLNENDMDHVTHGLGNLIDYIRGTDTVGHFLSAVVRNDFIDAVTCADGVNGQALTVYAKFLYNHVPRDLLELRRGELK